MHAPNYLGAHCSTAGGLYLAVERILALQGRALQIFTRNQRQWRQKPLQGSEIASFQQAWQKWGPFPILAHDSYLINLASSEHETRQRSIQAFARELERCALLGLRMLVTHPGACKDQSRPQGLRTYIQALDQSLRDAAQNCPQSAQVQILLETTAGQGTTLGADFQELAEIIAGSSFPERLHVCLDTCHVFAAGYELREAKGYAQTMHSLDKTVGLKRLQALHLNDCKSEPGSRLDRHEHIGYGKLGLEPFRFLLGDQQLAGLPMVLETPKDKQGHWDRANLAVLQGLIQTPE